MTTQEVLTNGTTVYVDETHRFGTDALLLARFTRVRRDEQAADLCAGCGIIALEWYDGGHRGRCLGVEINPQAHELFARAVRQNGCANITPLCADIRALPPDGLLHAVACNPPYFTAGAPSQNAQRAAARHEISCTLGDAAAAAARLLRDGGRLCLCLPPQRLTDAMCEMRAHRLEPKRLCMVRQTAAHTPWLCLLEAQKNRKSGLRLEPDICLAQTAVVYGRR